MTLKIEKAEVMQAAQKKAYQEIAKLIVIAQAAITDAESIADAADVGFDMGIGGYGMGGFYSDVDWQSSSQSC